MNIAVDVDDVCCPLMNEWLRRYNYEFDDNLQFDQITDWDVTRFVKPVAKERMLQYIEDPTIYDHIPPDKNALVVINNLRNYNARITYVTHSTLGASGRKYLWLKKHGFLNDPKDYVEAKDKSLIRAEFLIDDNYLNVTNFMGIGILINKPWNRKYQFHRRANSWYDVWKIIAKKQFEFLEREKFVK